MINRQGVGLATLVPLIGAASFTIATAACIFRHHHNKPARAISAPAATTTATTTTTSTSTVASSPSPTAVPSLHIGIVGCSAEGAALCYRTIVHEASSLMGAHAHPEISMHTHSLSLYVECLSRSDINGNRDWKGVGDLMLSSARHVTQSGARILLTPDNTIHTALPLIRDISPAPWLHIADVVANEGHTRGYKRLALLGTRWLIDSDLVYPLSLSRHNIECIRPTIDERNTINSIIMDELVNGLIKDESRVVLQLIIKRMATEHACDAVILGCTELPLILNDQNSVLPTLDSTRLLARAALRYSLTFASSSSAKVDSKGSSTAKA
jgi:aspartate racemase